jgi:hypothetical protein
VGALLELSGVLVGGAPLIATISPLAAVPSCLSLSTSAVPWSSPTFWFWKDTK